MRLTIDQLLAEFRGRNPRELYTKNECGKAIGKWLPRQQRWTTVAGEGIDGRWYPMIDLVVNGEPLIKQGDWIPVAESQSTEVLLPTFRRLMFKGEAKP